MPLGRKRLNRPPIVPLSAFRAELAWYVERYIWEEGFTVLARWPNKGAFQVLLMVSNWGEAGKMSPDNVSMGFCISFKEARAFLSLCTEAAACPYVGKALDDLTAKASNSNYEIRISRPKRSRQGTVKIGKAFKLPLAIPYH